MDSAPGSPEPLFDTGFKGFAQRLKAYGLFVVNAVSDYPDPARLRPKARAKQYYLWTRWYLTAPYLWVYRKVLLRRVTYICVTGSTGKTTTKELIVAVLSTRFRGRGNLGTDNRFRPIARFVLRLRPWHDFAVQELSGAHFQDRSMLEQPLSLLMPRIGAVTNVGTDHWRLIGGLDAIADEKGKLVAALPAHGTAILNADDPAVRAMASRARARVILYGTAAEADLRAENIGGSWPDRLRFDVIYRDQRYAVETRLLGAHWVSCVLAAIAAGLAMGIPIAEAAEAIAAVEPVALRMQPVVRPDGVTFIRDDVKAPPASIQTAFEFMANAKAERKIIIIGTVSDFFGGLEKVYAAAAEQALEVADLVVFVGHWAHKCLAVQRDHPKGRAIYALPSVKVGKDFLATLFRPGDLVLIKACVYVDETDALLTVPSAPAHQPAPPPQHGRTPKGHLLSREDLDIRVVVGLGNAGARYDRTPHNVGFRVLDMLAESLGGGWTETDDAMLATIPNGDKELVLVKPNARMNHSGEALARVRERIGFAPEECLIVFDDILLPIGATRFRTKGGYGGHQGCRSVIEALATTMVPRVRVGVGPPQDPDDITGYVLSNFAPENEPKIDAACREAVDKILVVLAR